MARRLAESGGAGLLVHWPGHGDSGGEPERTDLERMAAAAEQALGEARRRVPEPPWGIAGVRLGAAAATLAAVRAEAAALLLIRPALDPGRYFAELERASRRAGLGRVHGRPWAFGHPLPDVRSKPDVQAALAGFSGPAACMGYESDPPGPPAGELEAKRVPGSWESGMKARHGALVDAMLAWTLSSLEPVRA